MKENAAAYIEFADSCMRMGRERFLKMLAKTGWQIVPINPTPFQIHCGNEASGAEGVYHAMLTTAPEFPNVTP